MVKSVIRRQTNASVRSAGRCMGLGIGHVRGNYAEVPAQAYKLDTQETY